MTDELDLDAPIENKEQPLKNQEENNNANQRPPKKINKILIWSIVVVVLIVAGLFAVFFISLVQDNINDLGNTNATIYDISTLDDPYAGSLDANIVIVEFSDFQCPYCFEVFPTVREIIDYYGDQIRFIYRDFPIDDVHPQAQNAAEAAECAAEQDRFWEYHDKLFINQNDLGIVSLKSYATELGLDATQFNECLDSNRYYEEVQQDFASGIVAGVEGTPTFFINDVKFEGAITVENFKNIIDQLLVIFEEQG